MNALSVVVLFFLPKPKTTKAVDVTRATMRGRMNPKRMRRVLRLQMKLWCQRVVVSSQDANLPCRSRIIFLGWSSSPTKTTEGTSFIRSGNSAFAGLGAGIIRSAELDGGCGVWYSMFPSPKRNPFAAAPSSSPKAHWGWNRTWGSNSRPTLPEVDCLQPTRRRSYLRPSCSM